MEGFYFFDPVHGRILTFPIQFLVPFVDLGVPLFSVRCWCIHNLILATWKNTRPLRHATFGRDSRFSVEPGHVGPVAAVQSARGVCDNSPGSASVRRPRFWCDTADRPVGSILGLGLPVRGSALV